ncbi:MAG: acyl-CoA dehydrogenase family protein [Spirochaetales bacterium]|nr:acyl-CoA dehydrogenase family protein [Spirochaetales bacterium]
MDHMDMGFLERLYHGAYREDLLTAHGSPVDIPKVDSFVARYHDIVGHYNPLELEASPRIPDSLMNELKGLGIFGLTIPREYGGLGFTTNEYLLVVEAMARSDMALVLIPLAHLSIGLKGIVLYGNEAQKKRYLVPAATGEMIFAYALTEPKTGSDAQHIETHARLSEDGSHYLLNGGKTYITNGNYAGGMTVFAQLDPENRPGFMGAFVVETAWDGVEVGRDMPKMGLKVSSTTPIRFKNVRVPAENLIGEGGDGFKIAMNILNYGRLGLGAAGAGLMKQSVEDMEKRAASRKQFGVPIREFELIQEKIVAARAHAFAAANITSFTARLLEENPLMNVAIESSHTKLYGTNECWNTLYEALQTAGGAGFIQSMPYEKRMRDFRVTTIFEGTTEIHSIYPPLTVFRRIGKELKGAGAVRRLATLQRLSRPLLRSGVAGSDPTLRAAMSAARDSEKLFRRLLRYGLMRHGKGVVSEEFFLRKMTRLSVSLLWLISSVVTVRNRYGDQPIGEEDRALMQYLIAEAREVQAQNGSPEGGMLEAAHRMVMAAVRPVGAPPSTGTSQSESAKQTDAEMVSAR